MHRLHGNPLSALCGPPSGSGVSECAEHTSLRPPQPHAPRMTWLAAAATFHEGHARFPRCSHRSGTESNQPAVSHHDRHGVAASSLGGHLASLGYGKTIFNCAWLPLLLLGLAAGATVLDARTSADNREPIAESLGAAGD